VLIVEDEVLIRMGAVQMVEEAGFAVVEAGNADEAIRILESEGFVSVVPRRGVIVQRLTEQDVDELFDVREALEVLAARRAAERATKTELRQLAKALTAARRAIKSGNSGAIGAANENFHDELIKLAHNDLLAATLEPLQGRLHWLFRQHADPTALNQEHQRLFDAVASGNPERAAAEALNHVQVNRARAEHFLFGANAAAKSQLSDNAG